jgi:phage-related protein
MRKKGGRPRRRSNGVNTVGGTAARTTAGPKTQAVYYRERSGKEPASAFVEKLPSEARATVRRQLLRLNGRPLAAAPLPFPWTSQIEGELREFRGHYGDTLYRFLYRQSRALIVLLHAFEKHTGPVPDADKQKARLRWDDYVTRMAEKPRRRPRAAGRDAP